VDEKQFTDRIAGLVRAGAAGLAGILAAKGLTAGGNEVVLLAASSATIIATGVWSWVSKTPAAEKFITALPFDEVSELATVVQDFRARGASPTLVAHTAQVLATLATAEVSPPGAPTVLSPPPVAETTPLSPVSPAPVEAPLAAEVPPVSPPPVAAPGMAAGAFAPQVPA